jgi:hypothetical protein
MSRDKWDRTFLETIRRILLAEWDPIGLKEHCPRDEYDSYAMRVYSHLAAGWSMKEIASYLSEMEFVAMGIGTERRLSYELYPVAEHLLSEWNNFAGSRR